MRPSHVAASMAALKSAATAPAGPTVASAGPGTAGTPNTAYDAAMASARKAGAEAERIRISAILNHEAAAGRGKLAAHLAFKTSMSVEDAGEMLAASATGPTAGAGGETLVWDDIVADLNATLPSAQAEEGCR